MTRYIRDILNQIDSEWRYPAYELKNARVKGIRNNTRYCPIAKYLKQEADPVDDLEVDDVVVWYEDGVLQMFTFHNPMVSFFIRDFDKGKYPELIDE